MDRMRHKGLGAGPGPSTTVKWEGVTTLSKQSNAARQLIGNFAPKLVELTDRVLFDDIWERRELSQRDRSLITVAALIALNRRTSCDFISAKL